MKYVSLFAGIGGFDLALNRLGHECVYANDFDKYCKIIYDKNFSNKLNTETQDSNGGNKPDNTRSDGQGGRAYTYDYASRGLDCRSLTEVQAEDIPDHDILVGGFPCQSFSIAGKRGGFDDTRGTLFFDIARILKAKSPRLFILENVKGLLSHDNGNTFKTIIATLTELGYDLQWQVLNSKNFGVPQNRERVFIIGNIRGTPRPEVFPIRKSNEGNIQSSQEELGNGKRIRCEHIAGTLRGRDYKGGGNLIQYSKKSQDTKLSPLYEPGGVVMGREMSLSHLRKGEQKKQKDLGGLE